jgi:hypothetical protein
VTFDRNPSGMENVQPNIGMKMERKSRDKGIKEVGINNLKNQRRDLLHLTFENILIEKICTFLIYEFETIKISI